MFQQANGLNPDGKLGPKTLAKLRGEGTGAKRPPAPPPDTDPTIYKDNATKPWYLRSTTLVVGGGALLVLGYFMVRKGA